MKRPPCMQGIADRRSELSKSLAPVPQVDWREVCHGVFGHLSVNCDSSLEGFDKLQWLLLLYWSKERPLGGPECELRVSFFFTPSLSAFHLCQCGWNASGESIYSAVHCNMLWRGWIRPGGWLQDVLVEFFSMRRTVGEMDSRLWAIWLEPFDDYTVHKTVHLHTAGMTTTTKSVLQSRANVSPKMNKAFRVNDTSVWNIAAYFPHSFLFLVDPVLTMACELVCALIPS